MAKAQKTQRDPRGRKTNPRGKVRSNGLHEDQWTRIVAEGSEQGRDGAGQLRYIVDWYFLAKEQAVERQEGKFSQEEEFSKLKKSKSK